MVQDVQQLSLAMIIGHKLWMKSQHIGLTPADAETEAG